ncbi:MAG: DNA methyltransferase, partial [Oceanobacter sp.]
NGPRYEVLHPETRKPVPIPSRGWVFPNETRFWEEYENGRVVFGEDHTTSARIASYLFESDGQVMPSVFYSYAQTAAQDFSDLMGDKLFDNPKNWKDIERLIYYLTEPSDLVLDFFSGSGTTGHAICHSNISEPASRRFILVQLPEPCPTSSIALKNGMATIADIAKERLRRAGARLKSEQSAQLDLESNPEYQPDLGFKVFKLDRSNFKQWQAPSSAVSDGDLLQQMELSIDPVLPEATPEQMLYEILLKIGLPLTAEVTNIELAGAPVYSVEDGLVLIFLQGQMHQALIDAVLDAAPSQFICLDKAFEGNDQLKANAVKTFAHYNAGFEGDSERIDFRTL